MEKDISILNEATAALSKASGLSLSLSKAAFTIEKNIKASNLKENILTCVPSSEEEGTQLREAGIRLYNITRKGPSNDVSLLKLRLLACEAMKGSGGLAASDENSELKRLDNMRCFSKTGLLLMSISETELAIGALTSALNLICGDAKEVIQRVFGETQEAHDCGSSLFSALCCLFEMQFEMLATQIPENKESRQELISSMLKRLQENLSFIAVVHSSKQEVLRLILEAGIIKLSLRESLCFQQWMYTEWVKFSSSNPGLEQQVALRLAFSLAKCQDTIGSLGVLEKAETVEGLSFEESKHNSQFLLLTRCAVATSEVSNESKMYNLISPSFSSGNKESTSLNADAKIRLEESLQQLIVKAIQRFEELVFDFSFGPVGSEINERVLDCAADLCVSTSFQDSVLSSTYEVLIEKALPNTNLASEVLIHALKNKLPGKWVFSCHGLLALIASQGEKKYRFRLAKKLWNEVCKYQQLEMWLEVVDGVKCIAQLTEGDLDVDLEMKSRCLQASAVATMALFLPNKEGDVEQELQILREASRRAVLAGDISKDMDMKSSAAILELSCLARQSVLEQESDFQNRIILTCIRHLQNNILPVEGILRIVEEAEGVNAIDCALSILESARDYFLNASKADTSLIRMTQLIVEKKLKAKRFADAARDCEILLERYTEENSMVSEFKLWIQSTFTSFLTKPVNSMEDALDVSALMLVVFQLEKDEDVLCAVAGGLMQAAVQFSKLETDRKPLSMQCGEKTTRMLSLISRTRKRTDSKVANAALFSCLFGGCIDGSENADAVVAERVKSLCEEGEFAFPKPLALEKASAVAKQLGFIQSSREILLRLVQAAFREAATEEYIVRECFLKLILDSDQKDAIEEWMDQIENLWQTNSSGISAETLEKCSISCWKKRQFLSEEYCQLCRVWLQRACDLNEDVLTRRSKEIQGMRNFNYRVPKAQA